jgi:hypothetical protein
MLGIALGAMLGTGATAQEVVMRRPLPIKEGTGTQVPSDQSETPTPTPTPTPTDNPLIEDHPDPTTETCDRDPTSPKARVVDARWIETGWKTVGTPQDYQGTTCTSQQMGYACQATYVCQVDGESLTFTDLAPASYCPDIQPEPDPGSCPPGYHYPPDQEGAQCQPDDGGFDPGPIGVIG